MVVHISSNILIDYSMIIVCEVFLSYFIWFSFYVSYLFALFVGVPWISIATYILHMLAQNFLLVL